MANEENLKPFSSEYQPKKNGRPKGSLNTKTILNKFLDIKIDQKNPFTKKQEKMLVKEMMNLVLIKNALEGDLASYKEVVDRIEGKTTTTIDHTTKGESLNYTKEDRDKRLQELLKERKDVD